MTNDTQTYSLCRELAENHSGYLQEGDELLREIVSDNRKRNYAESTFFRHRLGWDDGEINIQTRRMAAVLRFRAIAGTSADRDAAATEATTSAAVHAKEHPKLLAKIQELQGKADGLVRDAELSQKRSEQQTDAVEKLRELCPEHVSEKVKADVQSVKNSIGREISDAETRAHEIECCLDPGRYPDEPTWLEMLERSCRLAVDRIGSPIERHLSAAWPAIRADMEKELSELNTKLSDLRPQYEIALELARKPLNYYAG
jgi:hypothetical protein